ncbi:MAG: response regulator [Deltaproteobacteria bacterium]|nr:response regulator [Deltaproteobacteria bacterium]
MMNMMRGLKISNKLGAVFIFLAVMMVIGGGVGYYNATAVVRMAGGVYAGAFTLFETLTDLENELMSERQEVLIHVSLDDKDSKVFLSESLNVRRTKIRELLSKFESMAKEEDHALVAVFKENIENYWKFEAELIGLSLSGKKQLALRAESEKVKPAFMKAVSSLHDMITEEKSDIAGGYHEAEMFGNRVNLITVSATAIALIVAIGMWWLLTRSIVVPIRVIAESARKMTVGDLSHRAAVLGDDELGNLARDFNRMADALQYHYDNLGKEVEERTEELRLANEELSVKKVELEKKNDQLDKASRMKSQFLANVSHELRTPLNSVIGFSELLQEKSFGELNEKQLQYVKFINTSGTHLLNLINSILDLSKVEAGKMELMPENVVLSDFLVEVISTVRPIAQKRNISIEAKAAPVSPVLSIDRGKMRQVLLNLMSNAVKFNVEGGRVIVDWDIREEPFGMTMRRFLFISVQDTGIGIKPEDMGKLFREFEQLDPSVTREYGGTGLGLALTKKLIELHGGEIWGEGEEGKGCKFTIKLPHAGTTLEVVEPQVLFDMQPGAAETAAAKAGYERPLILVAAESNELAKLVDAYLSSPDLYNVITASDGAELVDKAREERPFAIVMGIALQKKDGWQVMKELKLYEETRDIPVVIISSANERELGFALGAVDYLEKPVDKGMLMGALKRLSFTTKVKSRKLSILTVDDDPQVLTLLGDMLKKEGFIVFRAQSGKDAVEIATEKVPDLIILDLMMPEMSGFDVVDKLKEGFATKNIPVMIFTAKDITSDDKTRLGSGIRRVIPKAGFSKDDLVSEIRLLELAYPEKAFMVDTLTKSYNRRYVELQLPREVARSERYGQAFSTMFVGVDNLGDIASKYGIEAANTVLCDISEFLQSKLRRADCCARYDDDVFCAILPGTAVDETIRVAEKLKEGLMEHGFRGVLPPGTVSLSIAIISCPDNATDDILTKLEGTLRNSRDTGGNKISVYGRKRSDG